MSKGKAIKFGNNVDTDQIIAACHLTLPTIEEMAALTFEHYPNFTDHFTPGDFVVGESNFGCGSSREQAPAVLKARGVRAIVAKSFARIFYRNAINIGIMLIECSEANKISMGDDLALDGACLKNMNTGDKYEIAPYPKFIQSIFEKGGIVKQLQN